MPEYIVRVELLGTPDEQVYEKLHTLMSQEGFNLVAPRVGGGYISLPHATYYGSNAASAAALAAPLRDQIQRQVWTKAKVLAIAYTEANQADPT